MNEKWLKDLKYKKTEDQKYCFVPKIWFNLHLVNFDMIRSTVHTACDNMSKSKSEKLTFAFQMIRLSY